MEPIPHRAGGPPLSFGGSGLYEALIRLIVKYGSELNPLGSPAPSDMEKLAKAMRSAGREMRELEMVGAAK